MFAKITILTSFIFAVIYPLCFWISRHDPLKNRFHKFHLALPNVVGGVVLVFIWLMDIPLSVKIWVTVWKVAFFATARILWKKPYIKPEPFLIANCLGLYAFAQVYTALLGFNLAGIIAWVIGGLILCASLYAMNLGHWYLNVHGLPLSHLFRALYTFLAVLILRLLWDIYFLYFGTVSFDGEGISTARFMLTTDGFLLILALLFGTVFPAISLCFAHATLKLKNTQATTGILYVILCSVLLGDMAYKYYLIKFGVVL